MVKSDAYSRGTHSAPIPSRFRFHPDPMIAARQSPDKIELFSGYRFKVSRIESTGAVLIENKRRLREAAIWALIGLPFSIPFYLLVFQLFSGEFGEIGNTIGDFFGLFVVGVFLFCGFGLTSQAAIEFVHSLFPRRILIHNGTLRFEGLPGLGLRVHLSEIPAVYIVTTWSKNGWHSHVAIAVSLRHKTRLLSVHREEMIRFSKPPEETQLILENRPIAILLRDVLGKPGKIQRGSQKTPSRLRSFWR
jgi:hypothetical protein